MYPHKQENWKKKMERKHERLENSGKGSSAQPYPSPGKPFHCSSASEFEHRDTHTNGIDEI